MHSVMTPNQGSSFTSGDISRLDGQQQAHGRQRLDGNTVDPQREMVNMAENQLMHELTMRMIKGKLGGLANAIKEGR